MKKRRVRNERRSATPVSEAKKSLKKLRVSIDKRLFDEYNIDIYKCVEIKMDTNESLKILKALGEETRLQIFEMLRGGKLCACKILERFDITQPTLSHHMKILCDCGIVIAEKDWKWTYYFINCAKLDEFLAFFGDTKCHTENECKCKNNCE